MTDFVALSDEQLIDTFIDGIVQGARPLQANSHLRVEPVFDSLQLLSSKEGMIATVSLKKIPTRVDLRIRTEYWTLVHDKLLSSGYFPCQMIKAGEAYQYQYCEVPKGYSVYCTTAKDLWRASWGRGFGLRSGIPLDLIVWRPVIDQQPQKQPWQSLRGMDCDRGKLLIKLLGQSITMESYDLVVWAKTVMVPAQTRSQDYRESIRHHRY